MATKKQTGETVVKQYRVLTPVRFDADTEFGVGEKIDLNEADAAELVDAKALEEL